MANLQESTVNTDTSNEKDHPDDKEKRKQKWDEIKRQGIINAAIRVITERGIENLTMSDVAHEAGVAKGTLYVYFSDKESLIASVWEASLNPIVHELMLVMESSLDPERILTYLTQRHLKYFDDNKNLFRVILYDRFQSHSHVERYLDSHYSNSVEKISKVIERGIEIGVFRSISPKKFAAMFVESNIAVSSHRILLDDPTPVEEDANMITEIFLRGILNDEKKS